MQYFKIPISGKIPPLKIIFEYEDTVKKDLKVCVSRKSKLPNSSNSEIV